MPETIVNVDNLRKEFAGQLAVDDLSFTVAKGEILGLLGPNGAGKTTTIQMLLGLVTPTSGLISIFGMDLAKHRVEILQRANFSSAYVNLPHNLRVWENLLIFAQLYQVRGFKAKMDTLLEMFEIGHLRDKVTGKLSSGEQTRVNLCKALLNEPELLLLDEPTASLDPDIADKVRKILKQIQLQRHMTIINTSHNMLDVQELCDRILFINKGRIITAGSPTEIMNRFEQGSLEEVFIAIARSQDVISMGDGE